MAKDDWVILGCGYVGTRLAKELLAKGNNVRVCARNIARLEPLLQLGATAHAFDAAKSRAFGPAVYGLRSPIIVYSVPPVPGALAGDPVRRACEAAQAVGASRFIYLGSTAVYGPTTDGETVDEDSGLAISDGEASPRIADEQAIETIRLGGLSTVVLRLAAIYGPGRGVRERLRAGNYRVLDDGAHYYSRIHVDDLVGIVQAAADRAPRAALYCVADDRPTSQREYTDWLVARLGVPQPPSVPTLAPGQPRRLVRNRRVSNAKLKAELGYTLLYPSFLEGEAQIEEETHAGSSLPTPVPVAPVATPTPTPVATPTPKSKSKSVAKPTPVATPAPVTTPAPIVTPAPIAAESTAAQPRLFIERIELPAGCTLTLSGDAHETLLYALDALSVDGTLLPESGSRTLWAGQTATVTTLTAARLLRVRLH